MNYIQATNTTIIKYPFSRSDLSATYPNVSFPPSPTADDLAPFDIHPVIPSPRPADTRDERAIEGDPTLTDAGWRQAWTVRPATDDEQTAWDAAHAPSPDWMSFGIELAANPSISALYDNIPNALANGLSIGLAEASKGDTRLFVGLWQRVLSAGGVSPELLGEIGALAYQFNLPAAFIAQMMPQPEV
jgi:hypothetical protein